MKSYKIDLLWDNEACVWVATSEDEDIKGLVLESGSFDALIERIKIAVPELLELNEKGKKSSITILFNVTRSETVVL